jgi:NAD(P)H-flavin reductase
MPASLPPECPHQPEKLSSTVEVTDPKGRRPKGSLERLEAIRGRMQGLEIVPVLSEPGPGWAGETGLVTGAVDRRLPG